MDKRLDELISGPADEPAKVTGELIAHRIVGRDFWSIATIKRSDTGAHVGAVGKLLGADVGDTVELEGSWSTHPKFGRQYKVRSCRVTVPQSDNGVTAWLSAKLPGVGRVTARALLDHFGGPQGLWKAVEDAPESLTEVRGVTEAKASRIAEAYLAARGDRDRMIQFRQWGFTENQIATVIAKHGDRSTERIRENPYSMAMADGKGGIRGFGFLRADAIAQRMGIAPDNEHRIECGIRHTLTMAEGHGHCYVPMGKLVKMAADKVLRIDGDTVALRAAIMRKRGSLVQHGTRTFSRRLNLDERRCADGIRRLLAAGPKGGR